MFTFWKIFKKHNTQNQYLIYIKYCIILTSVIPDMTFKEHGLHGKNTEKHVFLELTFFKRQ